MLWIQRRHKSVMSYTWIHDTFPRYKLISKLLPFETLMKTWWIGGGSWEGSCDWGGRRGENLPWKRNKSRNKNLVKRVGKIIEEKFYIFLSENMNPPVTVLWLSKLTLELVFFDIYICIGKPESASDGVVIFKACFKGICIRF